MVISLPAGEPDLSGNLAIDIGVLSYAGQLNVAAIADHDNCPDLSTFVAGLNRCLSDLINATTTRR